MINGNIYNTIEILEYVDTRGVSPFNKWFNKLDPQAAAKISIVLYRMKQGNFSNVKGMRSGVYENRVHYGPGYRIYFGKDGEKFLILLCGGTKQLQNNDIQLAKQYWNDYKNRKRMKNAVKQTV